MIAMSGGQMSDMTRTRLESSENSSEKCQEIVRSANSLLSFHTMCCSYGDTQSRFAVARALIPPGQSARAFRTAAQPHNDFVYHAFLREICQRGRVCLFVQASTNGLVR